MINLLPASQLRIAFLTLFTFSFGLVSAQDFDHYRSLQSKGPIPAEFTTSTLEKVNNDILTKETKLTPTNKRIFFESVHSSIDPILHSGLVIYGDEISVYVNAIADRLLASNPDLRAQLRFYTIKSNVTNALSTEQGIIFVTTGLISQLTSEAQLAYILSHEIAHFTEHHVMENYEYKKNNAVVNYKKYLQSTERSRENELSADKIALDFYHKAGYSDEEIISTFDVLMYSYLPFDEVTIPEGYFTTEKMYIPDSYFSDKPFPITAEEDYDDTGSSHPNIKSRKKAITALLETYSNWGSDVNPMGADRFNNTREIARFESVRTSVVDGEYREALYSIFLLERRYPSSVYLQEMKAQSWFGILQLSVNGGASGKLTGTSEGEAGALDFFIGKLGRKQRLTVAFRHIYDLQKQYPEDKMIAMILEKSMKALAGANNFKLEDYSAQDYQTALKPKAVVYDSLAAAEEDSKSKYDKIKLKKKTIQTEIADTTEFHLYALSDIVSDSVFVNSFKNYVSMAEAEKEKRKSEELSTVLKKKKKSKDPDISDRDLDISKVIVVEPSARNFNKRDEYLWKNAEKMKAVVHAATNESLNNRGTETINVTGADLDSTGTDGFNERSLLYGFLEQTISNESQDFVPVDFDMLQEIAKKYGTQNVLFTNTNYHRHPSGIEPLFVIGSIIFYPALPFVLFLYIPIKSHRANDLTTTVLLMDLSGDLSGRGRISSYSKPTVPKIDKAYQDIFQQLVRQR